MEDVPCGVGEDVPCDVVEDVANHDVVVEGDASNLYVEVVVEDVPNPHVVVVVEDDPNLVGDDPNPVVGEAPGRYVVMVGYLASPHVVVIVVPDPPVVVTIVVVVPHCYATILMGSWEILHCYLIMAVYQC